MAAGRSSANSITGRLLRGALAVGCALSAAAPMGYVQGVEMGDVAPSPSLDDAVIARGWRVVRQVDCARCHGKNYDGLAAPSIVEYAATQTREQFNRMIVDGDPGRGMPGYRSNPLVVENLEDIRRYFVARSMGAIGPEYRAPAVR